MSLLGLKNWDRITSLLHLGLAITVTMQLLTSQLMKHDITHAFLFHEIFGLSAVCIVTIHWFWNLRGNTHNINHLFPWNKAGMLAISNDLKLALHGHLPQGGDRSGLPGFIHGLGFLAVTGMATSGFIIFISILLSINATWIKSIHSFISTFVWIYWIGHVGMALIHHIVERIKQ